MKIKFKQIFRLFLCTIILFLNFWILPASAAEENAVFAGGCFWCLEHDLEGLKGVVFAESGYTGGSLLNPTYENHNGHQEAVKVVFETDEISYEKLLSIFWLNIDPFDNKGQFCDRGNSYKPVIFTNSPEQEIKAISSIDIAADKLREPRESIKVEILPLKEFWPAEEYHQDFAVNNSLKYNFYRYSCGRDKRLDEVWAESKN